VKAFNQRPGVDFGSTYALVCRIGSQPVLMALTCKYEWTVQQLDVKTVFLQSRLKTPVYVQIAPGTQGYDKRTGQPLVMKLRSTLYGLSQSPSAWFGEIDGLLSEIGFKTTLSDLCVYIYNQTRHKKGRNRHTYAFRGRYTTPRRM